MPIPVMMVFVMLCASVADSALTCTDVFNDLRPCVAYIEFGSGMPPVACCTGVTTLASAAKSTEEKKTVCECIKSATQQSNGDLQLAKDLPKNCGITNLPVEISPTVKLRSSAAIERMLAAFKEDWN
ncbi:unnamed protein product [Rhodiola kirilowii]